MVPHRMVTGALLGTIAMLALLSSVGATQTKQCCPKLKQLQDMIICDNPCCLGFHEVISEPPGLGLMVYCEKTRVEPSPKLNFFDMFRQRRRYGGA